MTKVQPVQPSTLWEWLCQFFHRSATTRIPHWDSVEPEKLILADKEAEWAELAALIDRHAAAGSFDDSHSDLVDRLVLDKTATWKADVSKQYDKRVRTLEMLGEQGMAHYVRISLLVKDLRDMSDRHRSESRRAWSTLAGVQAPATPEGLAEPLPPKIVVPREEPDAQTQAEPTLNQPDDDEPIPLSPGSELGGDSQPDSARKAE